MLNSFQTVREARFHTTQFSLLDFLRLAQTTLALGALFGQNVAHIGTIAHEFPGASLLEAFGSGLSGFHL